MELLVKTCIYKIKRILFKRSGTILVIGHRNKLKSKCYCGTISIIVGMKCLYF